MKVSMPQPPHRLDRLRAWMDDEKLDCTVVFGTDNVNHLCGYWRYFGARPRSSSGATASARSW